MMKHRRLLIALAVVLGTLPGYADSGVNTLYISGWIGFDASVAWPLSVLAMQPVITGHSPPYVTAGFSRAITIYGSNFSAASVGLWQGQNRATQFDFNNPGQIVVTIQPGDAPTPGTYPMMVLNPGPLYSGTENIDVVAPAVMNGFVNLASPLPVNASLQVSADNAANISWSVSAQRGGAAGGSAGAPTLFATSTPAMSLSWPTTQLGAGTYHITATAVNIAGDPSSPAEADVTFVAASNLDAVRMYPNPWRADKHAGTPITFDHLTGDATVKIFTISARLVATLSSQTGLASWDLKNSSGDSVQSGVYLYVVTDDQGDKSTGKFTVIR